MFGVSILVFNNTDASLRRGSGPQNLSTRTRPAVPTARSERTHVTAAGSHEDGTAWHPEADRQWTCEQIKATPVYASAEALFSYVARSYYFGGRSWHY